MGRSLHQCHKFADGTCDLYLAAGVLALFAVATSVPVVYYSHALAVYDARPRSSSTTTRYSLILSVYVWHAMLKKKKHPMPRF